MERDQSADEISVAYRVGEPYTINGNRFVPHAHADYDVKGTASWYGTHMSGDPTASGRPFDPEDMTAAHRTLPIGQIVRVTRLSTGESVRVRIVDRGPFILGRVIDLSPAAAQRLEFYQNGLAEVRVEALDAS